jgi:hypothetical protein
MVSCPYDDFTAEFTELKSEKGYENIDPSLENYVGIQRLRWNYPNTGDSPSRFSISSVDPLHYLPITPSIHNGELFNIC